MADYTFTDIAVPNTATVVAEGIDAAGEVVGLYTDVDGADHGFSYKGGVLTTIDTPGASSTGAVAINASGEILLQDTRTTSAGDVYESYVIDERGQRQAIVIPDAEQVFANAINDFGQVVGTYTDASGKRVAFVDVGGKITTINAAPFAVSDPGDSSFSAQAINNHGQVVVTYSDKNNKTQSFVSYGGSSTALTYAPASSISASSINEAGQVAGLLSEGANNYVFIEDNNQYSTFQLPADLQNAAVRGINEAGDVAGFYQDKAQQYHGFVIEHGALTIVNDAAHPQTAYLALNDAGELVGASISNGIITGLAATPAPAPTPTPTPTPTPAPTPAPAPTPPTAPDAVSLSPDVSYRRGVFTLTGAASSAAGVKGVEISAVVDGVRQDLGAATVNADGTFSFSDLVGRHGQGFITATLMDGAGGSAAGTAAYGLEGGLAQNGFRARQTSYTADGSAVTATALFRADGSRSVTVEAPGQTFTSDVFDTFRNRGAADTTFVFKPGHGLDVVGGFVLGGDGHGTLSFDGADFGNDVAAVLANAQNAKGGVEIVDPVTLDTVKLSGITKQQIAQNRGDFAFHG